MIANLDFIQVTISKGKPGISECCIMMQMMQMQKRFGFFV